MRSFVVLIILIVNLNASSDKYLDVLKEYTRQGKEKLEEYTVKGQKKLNEYTIQGKQRIKEYSTHGKNLLIEKTLLNGINLLTDNSKIKINSFGIDDKSNEIKINMFLKGEDKNLTVDIKKFKWGVTKDKNYIVFEDFDINMNIPWMQYITGYIAEKDRGYIKFPHDVALFSLLYSIKPNIKSTYEYSKKKSFPITEYKFDEKFIKIRKLEIAKNKIITNIWLKGSRRNLEVNIGSYKVTTANKKTILVLKDMDFRWCSKPWIESIIYLQYNQVHLEYSKKLFELLTR